MQITAHQSRMARALLKMSTAVLAQKTKLTAASISGFENGHTDPHAKTIELLASVLEEAGAEFLPNDGVRRRNNLLRVINQETPYLKILDDIFYTLPQGGEALFAFISNRKSPPEVIASQKRLRAAGVRFRALISEDDDYCLYPLSEYRLVPRRYWEQNTEVVYGDKVASIITEGEKKTGIIITNASVARKQSNYFQMAWDIGRRPEMTSAKVVYE